MNDSRNMDAAIATTPQSSVRTMDKGRARGRTTTKSPGLARWQHIMLDAGTGKTGELHGGHLKRPPTMPSDVELAGGVERLPAVDVDTEAGYFISTGEGVEFVIGNLPVGVMRHVKVKSGL